MNLTELGEIEEDGIAFKLAKDPTTPSEKLEELVILDNINLNRIILNHPNASKSLVKGLLDDDTYDYAYFLLENPKYPEMKARRTLSHLLFEDFTKEKDFHGLLKMIPLLHDRYLVYLAVNHHTPPGILADMALRGGDYLKKIIAKNPNTPPKTLKLLSSISS